MSEPRDHEAVLYVRPACPLCYVLKREAGRAARRNHFDLRCVDVRSDPELEQRYGCEVPVLVLPGGGTIRGRAAPGQVEAAFSKAARKSLVTQKS
jgi:predicted DsbA family dithiol-disulfide isomerase